MTAAAKVFGKRVDVFMKGEETTAYIGKLDKVLTTTKRCEFSSSPSIVETRMGRNGGTWAHPKLAEFFARWLDTKFAVWCDMVIDDILNKKMEVKVVKPEQSMAMRVPKSFPEALRLAAEMAERNEKL